MLLLWQSLPSGSGRWGLKRAALHPAPSTHEFLVMVVGEEHLEPRWPVVPPPQQPVGTLVPTHVAVPGVFLDGCLCSPWPHQQIHTLHAKAPGRKQGERRGRSPPGQDGAWLWLQRWAGWAAKVQVPGKEDCTSCLRGRASPAAIVVPTHEHLTPPAADGAVGLIAVIIVLVRTFQEAVLGSSVEAQRPMGRAAPRPASAKTGGKRRGERHPKPNSTTCPAPTSH